MRGLVIKNTGSQYIVKTDEGIFIDCRIKGNFRLKAEDLPNLGIKPRSLALQSHKGSPIQFSQGYTQMSSQL